MKVFSIHRYALLPVLAIGLLFGSCSKQDTTDTTPGPVAALGTTSTQVNSFYGPQVHMGDGKARSFISIDKSGIPQEIGVELTAGAMYNLPLDEHNFAAATFMLPLHQKAMQATAFDHVMLNWNVHGHEPPGVFDVPHFDFHFYMITQAEQMAIPPYEVNPTGFNNLPAPGTWPLMYIPLPGGVPQMGRHWLSTTFTPPFSYTMIYGSYAGEFIFMEPMITRAFLLGGTSVSIPYSPLRGFPVMGRWYPQTYNIYADGGKHYVSLSNFTWH